MKNILGRNLKTPTKGRSLPEMWHFILIAPYCVTQSRALKSLFHFHLGHCGWLSIRGNFPTKGTVKRRMGEGQEEIVESGERNLGNKMSPCQLRTGKPLFNLLSFPRFEIYLGTLRAHFQIDKRILIFMTRFFLPHDM